MKIDAGLRDPHGTNPIVELVEGEPACSGMRGELVGGGLAVGVRCAKVRMTALHLPVSTLPPA
jgi:hypothetical protein